MLHSELTTSMITMLLEWDIRIKLRFEYFLVTIIFCFLCDVCSCIEDIRQMESESPFSVSRY